MNVKKSEKKESVTQIQKDSVITSEDIPNPVFRFNVTLALLIPLLLVVAIYSGIINP